VIKTQSWWRGNNKKKRKIDWITSCN
jgi:hypothetical protein